MKLPSKSIEEFRYKIQKEIKNWDFHFDSVRSQENLTDAQKSEILEGINEIRKIFGDKWLEDAVRKGHPFIRYLIERAPWCRLSIADFGRKLEELSSKTDFDDLKQRLMNKEEFNGAEIELEIASKINRIDLDLEFYPKINEKGADLVVSIDNKNVFFEITSVQTSQYNKRASEVLLELNYPYFISRNVVVGFRVHKILSKPHIRELKLKIEKGIEEAIAKEILIQIIEPNEIEYFICPRSKVDEIKRENPNVLLGTSKGPPLDPDEPRRIRRAIEQKNNQLPKDKPGVIVIYNDESISHTDIASIMYLKEQIEETIYEHENLIFVVIINRMLSIGEDKIHQEQNYLAIQKFHYELLRESILIIKNKYSKFRNEEKLINAFA